jgi:parallel beta-helix repeat protein
MSRAGFLRTAGVAGAGVAGAMVGASGVASAQAMPIECTVDANNLPPGKTPVQAIQDAADSCDIVNLKGTFDFGSYGTVFVYDPDYDPENPDYINRMITIRGELDANGNPLTTINGGNYTLAVGIKPRTWTSFGHPWKYFIDVLGHPAFGSSISPSDCTPVDFEISNIKFVDPMISAVMVGNTEGGGSVNNCHFVDGKQVHTGNLPFAPIAAAIDVVGIAPFKAGGGPGMVKGDIHLTDNKIWCEYRTLPEPISGATIEYGGSHLKGLTYGVFKHYSSCDLTIDGNEIYNGMFGVLSGAGTYSAHSGKDTITGNTVEVDFFSGPAPDWLLHMVGILVVGDAERSTGLSATIYNNNVIVKGIQGPRAVGIGLRREDNSLNPNASIELNTVACSGGPDTDVEGIYVAETANSKVVDNTITGTGYKGINVVGTLSTGELSEYAAEFNVFEGNDTSQFHAMNAQVYLGPNTYDNAFAYNSFGNIIGQAEAGLKCEGDNNMFEENEWMTNYPNWEEGFVNKGLWWFTSDSSGNQVINPWVRGEVKWDKHWRDDSGANTHIPS